MDVPISLALILASAISLYETIHSGHHAYFDAAVMLCLLPADRALSGLSHPRRRALGRRGTGRAGSAARHRLTRTGREVVPVPISEIWARRSGPVRPGARMPVDGEVARARPRSTALLTGESLPVFAGPRHGGQRGRGEPDRPLTLRVTAAGGQFAAPDGRSGRGGRGARRRATPALAERAARLVFAAGASAVVCAFGFWMWTTGGDLRFAVNIAAAVLIITCPCALGWRCRRWSRRPRGKLFRKGLLIKDGTALERLAEVDCVVFDKTGTLTMGTPEPVNLDAHPRMAQEVALALAGASGHPLARALAEGARARGIRAARVEDLREVPGYGVEGTWKGRRVRLGRAEWCGAAGAVAETATWLCTGEGEAPRAFTFTDRPRPGADVACGRCWRRASG
jgi:Cu2+-exporting ATPase